MNYWNLLIFSYLISGLRLDPIVYANRPIVLLFNSRIKVRNCWFYSVSILGFWLLKLVMMVVCDFNVEDDGCKESIKNRWMSKRGRDIWWWRKVKRERSYCE